MQKTLNEHYIYFYNYGEKPHLLVRVPKNIDDKKGYWPTRYFSIHKHGYDTALRKSVEYRDECIGKNTHYSSGLAYSKGPHDLSIESLVNMRSLGNIQKRYSQLRVSTLAMIAMFNQGRTMQEISILLDVDYDSIRRQMTTLKHRGFIYFTGYVSSENGGRRLYSYDITSTGYELILSFRDIVSEQNFKESKIFSINHYINVYSDLKSYGFYTTINEILVMLLLENNISVVSKMSRSSLKTTAEINYSLKSSCKKGLITSSNFEKPIQSKIKSAWKNPIYQLTDRGKEIIKLSRSI